MKARTFLMTAYASGLRLSELCSLRGCDIDSVKKNAPDDARYERKTAKDDSPYFVLTAANGQTIVSV